MQEAARGCPYELDDLESMLVARVVHAQCLRVLVDELVCSLSGRARVQS